MLSSLSLPLSPSQFPNFRSSILVIYRDTSLFLPIGDAADDDLVFFRISTTHYELLRASVVSCGDEYTLFHIGIGLLRINSNSKLTNGDGDADGV